MNKEKRVEMIDALEKFVEKEGLGKIEYTPVRWNEQVHREVMAYIKRSYEAHEKTKKSRLRLGELVEN